MVFRFLSVSRKIGSKGIRAGIRRFKTRDWGLGMSEELFTSDNLTNSDRRLSVKDEGMSNRYYYAPRTMFHELSLALLPKIRGSGIVSTADEGRRLLVWRSKY